MDVVLYNTADGGEVVLEGGDLRTDGGVETAVFNSLFGANEEDSGDDDGKPKQWWGNVIETDENKLLRGRLQHLLRSIPATSGNLRLLEDAAAQDLEWMVKTKLASFVGAAASLPALNTVKIDVKTIINGVEYTPSFLRKWGST